MWNGTAWTESSNINTARVMPGGQTGTSTSGIIAGGYVSAPVANTENWNGSTWQETSDLSGARSGPGGAGADNTSAILFAGGAPGGAVATSEIWSSTSQTIKVLTD
jgi:hypothetical protein